MKTSHAVGMETATYVQGEMMSEAVYSVWVGGVEVNDYYLTEEFAKELAKLFVHDGYIDVLVTKETK